MLKKISLVSVATAMLLFSGCGKKPQVKMLSHTSSESQAIVKIDNGAGTPSWAANENKAFRNSLEASAKLTLKKGYKYFAINAPKEISTTKGSLRNTAKELLDYCSANSLVISNFGGSGLHKCGVYNTRMNIMITMYKEEQDGFLVVDAAKLLTYFKANDLLSDDELEISDK